MLNKSIVYIHCLLKSMAIIVVFMNVFIQSDDDPVIEPLALPPPKPWFLINATTEVADQFMAIFLAQEVDISRKLIELDILIGTMREDVQVCLNRASIRISSVLKQTCIGCISTVQSRCIGGKTAARGTIHTSHRQNELYDCTFECD